MRMLNSLALLLTGATLLCSNTITAESPGGKRLIVGETNTLTPATAAQAVLEDNRVREALATQDPAALQEALEDATQALPPEVRAQMGPVLVLSDVAERRDPGLYERMAEMLKANPTGASVEFDPRLITPEMLRAGAATDPQERYRLFEEGVSSLPPELRKQLANGFVVLDDPGVPSTTIQASPEIPRMSVDEAMASLPWEMQEGLRGYEHLFVDEQKLFRAMWSMPEEVAMAAHRIHRLRFPYPETEEAATQMAQLKSEAIAARERGYFLDEDAVPLPKELLTRIRQVRLMRGIDPAFKLEGQQHEDFVRFAKDTLENR